MSHGVTIFVGFPDHFTAQFAGSAEQTIWDRCREEPPAQNGEQAGRLPPSPCAERGKAEVHSWTAWVVYHPPCLRRAKGEYPSGAMWEPNPARDALPPSPCAERGRGEVYSKTAHPVVWRAPSQG